MSPFAAGASVVLVCERGMMVDYVSHHLAQRLGRLREQPLIRLITYLETTTMLNSTGREHWSQLRPPPFNPETTQRRALDAMTFQHTVLHDDHILSRCLRADHRLL